MIHSIPAPTTNNATIEKLHTACQHLSEQLTTISHQLHARHGITTLSPPAPDDIEILHAAPSSHIHSTAIQEVSSSSSSSSNHNGNALVACGFQEGEAYRCKCTFQIVPRSFTKNNGDNGSNDNAQQTTTTDDNDGDNDGDDDDDDIFIYVTRENGKIRPLPNGIFPPANGRIRRAMIDLMDCLNGKKNECVEDVEGSSSSIYAFGLLRNHLTSVTFVTSWGDGVAIERSQSEDGFNIENSCYIDGGGGDGDCLVTLHYGPPGLPTDVVDYEKCNNSLREWKEEARILCQKCNFTLVTGRSKGVKISVIGSTRDSMSGDNTSDKSILEEGIIHDDLWLTLHESSRDGAAKMVEIKMVSLVPPTVLQSREDESTQNTSKQQHDHVRIKYQKPATAFQHPNAGVMLTSLHWILNILSKMEKPTNKAATVEITETSGISSTTTKPRMLEMYCGCGAHTIPLAKSTLLSEIVAVELDGRLVNACRNNCRWNDCLEEKVNRDDHGDDTSDRPSVPDGNDGTLVQVFKGDAAEWAAKTLRRQLKHERNKMEQQSPSSSSNGNGNSRDYNNFDILLVDPPRDGLSSTVCDMAMKGTFSHVIYVSCGRRALLRDLAILCDVGGFDVADLAVIDLFPGTDAVESLVHLKRR